MALGLLIKGLLRSGAKSSKATKAAGKAAGGSKGPSALKKWTKRAGVLGAGAALFGGDEDSGADAGFEKASPLSLAGSGSTAGSSLVLFDFASTLDTGMINLPELPTLEIAVNDYDNIETRLNQDVEIPYDIEKMFDTEQGSLIIPKNTFLEFSSDKIKALSASVLTLSENLNLVNRQIAILNSRVASFENAVGQADDDNRRAVLNYNRDQDEKEIEGEKSTLKDFMKSKVDSGVETGKSFVKAALLSLATGIGAAVLGVGSSLFSQKLDEESGDEDWTLGEIGGGAAVAAATVVGAKMAGTAVGGAYKNASSKIASVASRAGQVAGAVGKAGATVAGAVGKAGAGVKGAAGAAGAATEAVGKAGASGVKGAAGAATEAVGKAGASGVKGAVGRAGLAGAKAIGEVAILAGKGAAGLAGRAGLAGAKAIGEVAISAGRSGAAGRAGLAGAKAIVEVAGAVGRTGLAGAKVAGVAGRAGVAGAKAGVAKGKQAVIQAAIKTIGPKKAASLAGRSLPGVSWLVGGGIAMYQAVQGDYTGAALTVGGSVGGIVTALPVLAVEIVREVYNAVYGTEENPYPHESDALSHPEYGERQAEIYVPVTDFVTDFFESNAEYPKDEKALQSAIDRDIYDYDIIGDSVVDISRIDELSQREMKAIVSDNDIDDTTHELLRSKIKHVDEETSSLSLLKLDHTDQMQRRKQNAGDLEISAIGLSDQEKLNRFEVQQARVHRQQTIAAVAANGGTVHYINEEPAFASEVNITSGPSSSIADSILQKPTAESEKQVVVVPITMNRKQPVRAVSRPEPLGMKSKSQSHMARGGVVTKDHWLTGTLSQSS